MKIGVAGAGALGSFFGGMLQTAGHDVLFLARGKHLEKMQTDGMLLEVNDRNYHIKGQFTNSYEDFRNVELVLFCVKSMDTDNNAQQLAKFLNKEAYILTMQNGVDNEEKLANIFGKDRIMSAATYVQAIIKEPGVIKQIRPQTSLVMGPLDSVLTSETEKVFEMFREVNIEVEHTDQIIKHKWKKLLWNVTFNPLSAIIEREVKYILDDSHLKSIAEAICKEAVNVAREDGIDFDQDMHKVILQNGENARNHKTSMLQDKLKGKKMEIESICGFIIHRGGELGIDTPVLSTIYNLLKFVENEIKV